MGRLQDRVALVTGASRGIGRAIAADFAAEGAIVVGTGRHAATGLPAMAEIVAGGGRARFLEGDVADEARVQEIVATVLADHGRIDIMVNNAAIQREGRLAEQRTSDFHDVVNTNLLGTFLFCRAVLPAMVTQGSGVIINVSSVLGLVGDPVLPVYCATKAGILGLTRSIAIAYADRGVRAVGLCPGDVDTELNQQYFDSQPDPAAFRSRIEREYPVRRIATVEEIARVATFLASDDASFIAGTHVLVDGGILSRIYEV